MASRLKLFDSEERPPEMPAGTRVMFIPERAMGMVLKQKLHYDGDQSFFGNVVIEMDDKRLIEANCWQCAKEQDLP